MRIERIVRLNREGKEVPSVRIVCETDDESKILSSIGKPKEYGDYTHHVRGELRLPDGSSELYVHLEPDPYRYYKDDLDFLGKTAGRSCDGDCCDTRPDHSDCPTCRAGSYINDAGEIIHEGAHEIRRELKDARAKG